MSTELNNFGIDAKAIEALLQSHNDLILAIHKSMVENYANIKCNVVSFFYLYFYA